MKVIQYRTREVYGVRREYVIDGRDKEILTNLTGQVCVNVLIREAIETLTDRAVTFEEVL